MTVGEFKELLEKSGARDEDQIRLNGGLSPDVRIDAVHPIDSMTGHVVIITGWSRDK